MTYLRCTIGRWTIDLDSEEGREAFGLIDTEGVRVFREQPGFVRYRLMLADPTTTIAVAEWESEDFWASRGRGATGSGLGAAG